MYNLDHLNIDTMPSKYIFFYCFLLLKDNWKWNLKNFKLIELKKILTFWHKVIFIIYSMIFFYFFF